MLTPKEVRFLFHYDAASGELRWSGHRVCNSVEGCEAGTVRKDKYRVVRIDGLNYLTHRLVWAWVYGEWPPSLIDHIDMNPSNNRVENLRLATHSSNKANRTKTKANSSGFKGVTFDKRRAHQSKPWKAVIKKDYKTINIGTFATPEEAHAAYAAKANALFGDFARAA